MNNGHHLTAAEGQQKTVEEEQAFNDAQLASLAEVKKRKKA